MPRNNLKRVEFNNITFGYSKSINVFSGLNFTINNLGQEGLIVALMGASGRGKTTVFKLLLDLVKPQKGEINFDVINPIMSYVPQEPVLFEHLTPLENATYFKYLKNYKERFDQKLFDSLVEILDLKDVLLYSKSVNEISGGQKQRLSLLRALSIQPQLLLLDEPCNGIDNELKRNFLIHLRKIITEQNIIAIYITHQPNEAKLVADELLFILSNKNELLNVYHDKVKNAFFKPSHIQVARFLYSPFINEIEINFDAEKRVINFVNEPNCRAIYPAHEFVDFFSDKQLEFKKEILSVYSNDERELFINTNEFQKTKEVPFECLIYDPNGNLIYTQ